MKLKEMADICHNNKGICKNCILANVPNWLDNMTTWCLMQVRIDYIKAYQDYKKENNEILAERTKKRYEEIEEQCLKGVK